MEMLDICDMAHQHALLLVQGLNSLLSKLEFVDVELECCGDRIHAHRLILAACSSYFYTRLLHSDGCTPISVENMSREELSAIVSYMYSGQVPHSIAKDEFSALCDKVGLFQSPSTEETSAVNPTRAEELPNEESMNHVGDQSSELGTNSQGIRTEMPDCCVGDGDSEVNSSQEVCFSWSDPVIQQSREESSSGHPVSMGPQRKSKRDQPGPLFSCEDCCKAFRSERQLHQHAKTHKSSRHPKHDAKCGECGKSFQSASKKRLHVAAVHRKERPFKCDQDGCQYAAADPSTLRQHCMSRHRDSQDSIVCERCARPFSTQKALNVHLRALHSSDILFPCEHCSYVSRFRSSLNSHLRRIHGTDLKGDKVTAKFKCSQCPFQSFTKYEFDRHLMKHKGLKPFQCPICDFATCEKGTLKKHMRLHTGQTPFRCKNCSKQFSSQSGLARHLRSHTGVKPYECPTCGKQYADKKSLDTHTFTHLNLKPFICHICTYSCVRKDVLSKHLLKVHGINSQKLPEHLDQNFGLHTMEGGMVSASTSEIRHTSPASISFVDPECISS